MEKETPEKIKEIKVQQWSTIVVAGLIGAGIGCRRIVTYSDTSSKE